MGAGSGGCRNFNQLQPLLDPSYSAIEIVQTHGQTGVIAMQSGNLALKPAEPDDNFIQFLALRRLLGADRAQHVQNKIGSLVAHNLLSLTNTRE